MITILRGGREMRQREGAYSEFRGAEAIFSHTASHGEIDGTYKIGYNF